MIDPHQTIRIGKVLGGLLKSLGPNQSQQPSPSVTSNVDAVAAIRTISRNFPSYESIVDRAIEYNNSGSELPFSYTLNHIEQHIVDRFKVHILRYALDQYRRSRDDGEKLNLLKGLASMLLDNNYHNYSSGDFSADLSHFTSEFQQDITDLVPNLGTLKRYSPGPQRQFLANHRLLDLAEASGRQPIACLRLILDQELDDDTKIQLIEKLMTVSDLDKLAGAIQAQFGTRPSTTDDNETQAADTPTVSSSEYQDDEPSMSREELQEFLLKAIMAINSPSNEDGGKTMADIKSELDDTSSFRVSLFIIDPIPTWILQPWSNHNVSGSVSDLCKNRYTGINGLENQVRDCFTNFIGRRMESAHLDEIEQGGQGQFDADLRLCCQFADLNDPRKEIGSSEQAIVEQVRNNFERLFTVLLMNAIHGNDFDGIDFKHPVNVQYFEPILNRLTNFVAAVKRLIE